MVAGDLVPSSDNKSAIFTGHVTGSANIHIVSGSLTPTDSGIITVNAGNAGQIRVETAANGSGTVVGAQSIVTGASITVYAISRDTAGNFISNIAGTWSLAGKTSGVANTDLVPSGDTKSAVYRSSRRFSLNPRDIRDVDHVDSGKLTVSTGGTAAQVRLETAADGSGTVIVAQSITSGANLTVYAVSRDAAGNFIGNVAVTWSLTGKTGGVLDSDLVPAANTKSAVFTGHAAGSGVIHIVSGSLTADSGMITVIAASSGGGGGSGLVCCALFQIYRIAACLLVAIPVACIAVLFHHMNARMPHKVAMREHIKNSAEKPMVSTYEASVPASFPPRPMQTETRAVETVWYRGDISEVAAEYRTGRT